MNKANWLVSKRALQVLPALILAWGSITMAGLAYSAQESRVTVGVVNVNTANLDELQLLPGVGPTRAKAILAQRKSQGGFRRIEDLQDVKGIGEAMLKKLRPHVILSGRTTARADRPAVKSRSSAGR